MSNLFSAAFARHSIVKMIDAIFALLRCVEMSVFSLLHADEVYIKEAI